MLTERNHAEHEEMTSAFEAVRRSDNYAGVLVGDVGEGYVHGRLILLCDVEHGPR